MAAGRARLKSLQNTDALASTTQSEQHAKPLPRGRAIAFLHDLLGRELAGWLAQRPAGSWRMSNGRADEPPEEIGTENPGQSGVNKAVNRDQIRA